MDGFAHLKVIGAHPDAKPLLDKVGVKPDEGMTDLAGFVETVKRRYWGREPNVRILA